MTKQAIVATSSKIATAIVLLVIAGYLTSNYLLSNYGPHEASVRRIIFSTIDYALIGVAVGYFLPEVWWLVGFSSWGLVMFSLVALSYSLTHGFADFGHSIFPPLLIGLSFLASFVVAKRQSTIEEPKARTRRRKRSA